MWICPECETRNEDGSKYCDCCGMSHMSEETPKVESRFKRLPVDTSRSDSPGDQKSHSYWYTTTNYSQGSIHSAEESKPEESSSLKEKVSNDDEIQLGQQKNSQAYLRRLKWIPLLISVIWILLDYLSDVPDRDSGNILNKIQSGNYQALIIFCAPLIATLFVYVKEIPSFLKKISVFLLGVVASYDCFFLYMWIGRKCTNWTYSNVIGILSIIMIMISLCIGIASAKACSRIQH